MNNFLTKAGLTLSLALSLGAATAVVAKPKTKPSAEHVAAIKKCNDDYAAAIKAADAMPGKTKAERKAKADAKAKARADKKQCIANAPK